LLMVDLKPLVISTLMTLKRTNKFKTIKNEKY